MDYYHNLITQKSWLELQNLKKTTNFVLIGGWAIYLYTQALKSKDIDILITYDELSKLKSQYNVAKNERLKKYEAILGDIQIDVYLPHYSDLGIKVEDLMDKTRAMQGFTVIDPEYLFVLKLYALAQRRRSSKGKKDFLDLVSLWQEEICDLEEIKKITKKYKFDKEVSFFREILGEYFSLPELDISQHFFSKLKKEINKSFIP